MNFKTQTRAEWRALIGAAVLGSTLGVALGGAYLAGGMARAASDQSRAERLAAVSQADLSEAALQLSTARMDQGALAVARRHDPLLGQPDPMVDRQAALLTARLEETTRRQRQDLVLRTSLGGAYAQEAAPYRHAGALDSSRDLDCLAQAVYYEARGETPAGQAAVAQVVLNRVRHRAFPRTVCGVVFQGAGTRVCQFSFACDGSTRGRREPGAWRRAEKVAARALSGYVMAEVGQATHFHTTAVRPNWGPRLLKVSQVGAHIFYRFGRSPAPYRGREAEPDLDAPRTVLASLAPAAPEGVELQLTGGPAIPEGGFSFVGLNQAAEAPAKPAASSTAPKAGASAKPAVAVEKPASPDAAPKADAPGAVAAS